VQLFFHKDTKTLRKPKIFWSLHVARRSDMSIGGTAKGRRPASMSAELQNRYTLSPCGRGLG